MNPREIVTRNITLFDADGSRAIHAKQIVLALDLWSALQGRLHFTKAVLSDGTVWLKPGEEELPKVIEAFNSSDLTSVEENGSPLHAIVDGMRLENVLLLGTLLGLDGLRVADVSATGKLESKDGVLTIQVRGAKGQVTKPFPFIGIVEDLNALVDTRPHRGSTLTAKLFRKDTEEEGSVELSYRVPEDQTEESDSILDLRIKADPIEAPTVLDLGFGFMRFFKGKIKGDVQLIGLAPALSLNSYLEVDGGEVQLNGTLGEQVEIAITTPGLELARSVQNAPEILIGGALNIVSAAQNENPVPGQSDSKTDSEFEVTADLEPCTYDGWKIPAFSLQGVGDENGFRLDEATARHRNGTLKLSGRFDDDGDVDLQAFVLIAELLHDPNAQHLLSGSQGTLSSNLRIKMNVMQESPKVAVRGTAEISRFKYHTLYAELIEANGFFESQRSTPTVEVKADVSSVYVGDYPLGEGTLQVKGEAGAYESNVALRTADRRTVSANSQIKYKPGGYATINIPEIRLGFGRNRYAGFVRNLAYRPGRDVSVEAIQLASATQSIRALGVIRFRGPDYIEAHMQKVSLELLPFLFGNAVPEVHGHADLDIVLAASLASPSVEAQLKLIDAKLYGINAINTSLKLNYVDGVMNIEGDFDLARSGQFTLVGNGVLDPREILRNPRETLQTGIFDLALSAEGASLNLLEQLGVLGMEGSEGNVSGEVELRGTPEIPSFNARLTGTELALPGWPTVDVQTEFSYDMGVFQGNVNVGDRQGPLGSVEASAVVDLMRLIDAPKDVIATLGVLPWTLSLRQEPRRLLELPLAIQEKLSIPDWLGPLRVGGSATLHSSAGISLGDVAATFLWDAPITGVCGTEGRPRAFLRGHLEDDRISLNADGMLGPSRVIQITSDAELPLGTWLADATAPERPQIRGEIKIEDVPLGDVPLVCEHVSGPWNAALQIENLLGDRPMAHLSMNSQGLRLRRFSESAGREEILATSPLDTEIEATINTHKADISGWIGSGPSQQIQFEGDTDVVWDYEHPIPYVADSTPVDAEANLVNAPLSVILAPIPQFSGVRGEANGNIRIRGTLGEPQFIGGFGIQDGYIGVNSLGQHLSEVSGSMQLDGKKAELRELLARDQEGSLVAQGTFDFEGWTPARASLGLRVRRFPVRQEGSLVAQLNGNLDFGATLTDNRLNAELDLIDLEASLPEVVGRTLQGLEEHPDVTYARRASAGSQPDPAYRFLVRVHTPSPFWMRRRDFEALIDLEGFKIKYADPAFKVRGVATIKRGFFEVYAKRFEVENAILTFRDNDTEINPQVRLQARHDTSEGDVVRVNVVGTLANPQITFSAANSNCETEGEILTMLVTGRCEASDDTGLGVTTEGAEQAANFLAGVTAGLFTFSLQQQLGTQLPSIAVEAGDDAFRSARVRVGYRFDDLLPPWLRTFVQGVYLEGSITAGGDEENTTSAATQNQGLGLLLQLDFPRNIVGTTTVSPPAGFSFDLTWEP
ncbi:MAG: translocation/assembly module TamB domain-containing protein [Myxococcota bacterium]